MSEIGIQRIMALIPHRPPFLMIDRVLEAVAGERAVAQKSVSVNEPFFEGHFPGNPVMPGVLLIEAMAQTAAVLAVITFQAAGETRIPYFISVEQARFRRPVFPGDSLRIEVAREKERGTVWKIAGRVLVGARMVADAAFLATGIDPALLADSSADRPA